MSSLKPPVELELSENKKLRDYILETASKPDFDYPPVLTCYVVYLSRSFSHIAPNYGRMEVYRKRLKGQMNIN